MNSMPGVVFALSYAIVHIKIFTCLVSRSVNARFTKSNLHNNKLGVT